MYECMYYNLAKAQLVRHWEDHINLTLKSSLAVANSQLPAVCNPIISLERG